jgi:hypothetical protein
MIVGEVHGAGGEHRAEGEAGESGGGHPRPAGQVLICNTLHVVTVKN